MTTRITASADGFLTNGSIFAMSNGDVVALFIRSKLGYYAVSQDGGATWGPSQALTGWSGVPNWLLGATQNGDAVALLTSPTFSSFLTGTATGAPLAISTFTYSTTLHQFGSPTTVTVTPPGAPANTLVQFAEILWNAGDSSYYIVYLSNINSGASVDVRFIKCATSGTVTQLLASGWAATTFYGFSTATISTTTFAVLAGDSSRTNATLFAVGISGSMTLSSVESVSAVTFDDAPQSVLLPDGSGHIDIVTQGQHTGHVYTLRRTAANTYSAVTTLATVDVSPRVPSAVFDPVTADAVVYYANATSPTAATLYAIRRLSGTWQAAQIVDTVQSVTANATMSTGHGLLAMAKPFATGTPIDYIGTPGAGAPNAPTGMTPNGYTNSLTPTLSSIYTNIAPGDIQKSLEDIVTRDSDGVVMWDSGEVITTASSEVYAGTALVLNTNYTWKRRYKDSLTSTWGPYASVPLIPAHLPVATITSVVFGGTTASATPFTLTNPSLAVNGTYTQADSDGADQLQAVLLAADGVTVQELGPVTSVTIAAGGSFAIPANTFTTLLNGQTGYVGVYVRDAVTGRRALGPLWQFTTAWPPPSAPTSLVVAPNDQAGNVLVTWANGTGSITGTVIDVSLDAGVTWTNHYTGPALTRRTLWNIAPNQPFLVRVALSNSVGTSAYTISPSMTLGLNAYLNGLILTDTVTLQSVFLGPTETEESIALKNVSSSQEIEEMGQKNYRYFFGRLATLQGTSIDVTLIASLRQQDGTSLTAQTQQTIFRALEFGHNDVLWRDLFGGIYTIKVLNVDPKPFKGRHVRVTFDVKQVDDAAVPLTST